MIRFFLLLIDMSDKEDQFLSLSNKEKEQKYAGASKQVLNVQSSNEYGSRSRVPVDLICSSVFWLVLVGSKRRDHYIAGPK